MSLFQNVYYYKTTYIGLNDDFLLNNEIDIIIKKHCTMLNQKKDCIKLVSPPSSLLIPPKLPQNVLTTTTQKGWSSLLQIVI